MVMGGLKDGGSMNVSGIGSVWRVGAELKDVFLMNVSGVGSICRVTGGLNQSIYA